MSSGFVSGGTTEYTPGNDSEWQKVKQELDESRKRRAEQGKHEGGKSLYEVLQQNKGMPIRGHISSSYFQKYEVL